MNFSIDISEGAKRIIAGVFLLMVLPHEVFIHDTQRRFSRNGRVIERNLCLKCWLHNKAKKMKASIKKYNNSLQSQKGFASLLLPRAHYIVVSKNIFQKSCNKASLSCGTSLTGSEFLAELQGRLALSVLDITQNFIPCQELMKLAQAHQVRPLQRKSVRKSLNLSLIFLTRKSSIVSNLFQRVRSAISLRCSVSFSVCS